MIKFDKKFKGSYGTGVYALAVLGILACIIVCAIVLQAANPKGNTKEILQTALNLLFQLANIGVLCAFLFTKRAKPTIFLKAKISPVFYVAGAVLGAVSLFCFLGLAESAQILLKAIGFKLSEPYVQGILTQDVFLLLVTVVFAPIAEELIFRSLLLSGLKRRFGHKRHGDIICALLCATAFSLMHMSPEQTVYTFCLGFGASMLALTCGSVIPAIIMHLVSNLIAAMSMIGVGGFTHFFDFYERVFMSSTAVYVVSTIGLAAAGAAIFVFGIKLLKRFAKPQALMESAETDDEPEVIEQARGGLRNQRPRKGLFKNFTDRTMIYYFLTLGLTVFLWVSVFISGI